MALMMREVIHELQVTWKEIWEQVRPLVVAVAAMSAVVLTITLTMPATTQHLRLLRLFVAAGAGALVYGAAVFVQRGPLNDEIMEVAKWIFRRGQRISAERSATFAAH